jgi:hypothetical protein
VAAWLYAVFDAPDPSSGTGATLLYLVVPPLDGGGADVTVLDRVEAALRQQPVVEIAAPGGHVVATIMRHDLSLEATIGVWSLVDAPYRPSLPYEVRVAVRGDGSGGGATLRSGRNAGSR